MPVVMASMFTATSAPRTFAGTNSAIYIGEMKEAMPIASPLTIIPAINQGTGGRKGRAQCARSKDKARQDDQFAASKAVREDPSSSRPDYSAHQNGADHDLLHGGGKRKLFLDKQYGPGDNACVITEEQAAEGKRPPPLRRKQKVLPLI